MSFKKSLLVALGLAFGMALANEPVNSEPYQQAFAEHVFNSLQQMASADLVQSDEPEAFLAELQLYAGYIARCHMRSMAQYDEKFSQMAYRVVAEGGSYERADELLQGALLAAISEGGDETQAVMQSAQRANLTFEACMAQVNQGAQP